MPNRPRLSRALSILALAMVPIAALSAPTPTETHLDFTVLKDGEPIGHHRIDFGRDGETERVTINTDIVVKIAYVPVYRFEHSGTEVWRNGHLAMLRSQTNDDGEKHSLAVAVKDDHLDVTGDGIASQAAADIIPASLWNMDLVKRSVLLNTLTGKQMAVDVADLGDNTVRSHGTSLPAHQYKVGGDLQREVWYDRAGTLVQVRFTAKDNSEIRYVLE